MESKLEIKFDHILAGYPEIPEPKKELVFAKSIGRRWRFDRAWVDAKVAVEIEGGTWVNGGHSRGAGFEKDCEKYNAAIMLGWAVVRLTGKMLNDENNFRLIERLIEERGLTY